MRSVAILGGRQDRNIPEVARGLYHIPQQTRQGFVIPARIMHLVVLVDFVGHAAVGQAVRDMKARGGRLYFVRGSRSAIDRVIREQVLCAIRAGSAS